MHYTANGQHTQGQYITKLSNSLLLTTRVQITAPQHTSKRFTAQLPVQLHEKPQIKKELYENIHNKKQKTI